MLELLQAHKSLRIAGQSRRGVEGRVTGRGTGSSAPGRPQGGATTSLYHVLRCLFVSGSRSGPHITDVRWKLPASQAGMA
jgi:hypothetical protein